MRVNVRYLNAQSAPTSGNARLPSNMGIITLSYISLNELYEENTISEHSESESRSVV